MARPVAFGEHASRPSEQVVVFSIAGQSFAVSAWSVQEIRSADNLGGVAHEISQRVVNTVRHVVERENRLYYVVSGHEYFRLRVSRPASVLILRDLPVALLVDRIEEMAEMRALFALPLSFHGLERRWYRGLTLLGGRVVPVLDPRGLLTQDELALLDSSAVAARALRSASEVRQRT